MVPSPKLRIFCLLCSSSMHFLPTLMQARTCNNWTWKTTSTSCSDISPGYTQCIKLILSLISEILVASLKFASLQCCRRCWELYMLILLIGLSKKFPTLRWSLNSFNHKLTISSIINLLTPNVVVIFRRHSIQ